MRLILQFCLLLLVLFGAETHAWGKVDVGQNIASGGLPVFLVDCTDGEAPPALITQGEPGPWDYELAPDVCNGPNLYAYVQQNPWTSFDPLGLAEDRVDPDGFKWSNNDHHIVPREVGRDAGWNKEAKEVFDRAKISTPNGHGNTAHPKYNQEVAGEMADFIKKQGVTDIGSAKNQKELAERFVEHLSKTDNPYIKGFNGAVAEGPAGFRLLVVL